MAASAPSSSGGEADPNSTNLRPPGYDAWCGVAHGCTRKLGMKICGFLQKNNSLEERSRIVSSFKERAAKNLLSCDNIGCLHSNLPLLITPSTLITPGRY
uniref:Glutamate decarboxylase 1 n=1 Tax=Stegastes partitus TaxID=144197 RepID=A0A3B4ZI10_9TELE